MKTPAQVRAAKGKAADRKRVAARWLRRALLATTLVLILHTASVTPEQQFDLRLSPLIDGQRFDWVSWEANAVWQELDWWLQGSRLAGDAASQRAEVLRFLDREQRVGELGRRMGVAGAGLPQPRLASPMTGYAAVLPAATPFEDQWEALYRQQQEAASRVERIVSTQVTRVLVAHRLGSGDAVWPPVAFRFNDMPAYLIISPREKILLYRGVFLVSDVADVDRMRAEGVIESNLDVSALVDDVGGIGSWPTMVMRTGSLRDLLDTVAHEWVHTYLFFRPLGIRYGESRDLTTMNETAASIVGAEVAELVIRDSYADVADAPRVADGAETGEDYSQPDEFSLSLRRIRHSVDELLAAGTVFEAERFMEAEREHLVAGGYHLRRLNQAYFAFHGSYATSPASADPIGPWMRELRAQSGSLKAFLERTAQMRSLDDLLRAVGHRSS